MLISAAHGVRRLLQCARISTYILSYELWNVEWNVEHRHHSLSSSCLLPALQHCTVCTQESDHSSIETRFWILDQISGERHNPNIHILLVDPRSRRTNQPTFLQFLMVSLFSSSVFPMTQYSAFRSRDTVIDQQWIDWRVAIANRPSVLDNELYLQYPKFWGLEEWVVNDSFGHLMPWRLQFPWKAHGKILYSESKFVFGEFEPCTVEGCLSQNCFNIGQLYYFSWPSLVINKL